MTSTFWWRLWHACGVAFWAALAARLPRGSIERFLFLLPFIIHGTMFFSKVPWAEGHDGPA